MKKKVSVVKVIAVVGLLVGVILIGLYFYGYAQGKKYAQKEKSISRIEYEASTWGSVNESVTLDLKNSLLKGINYRWETIECIQDRELSETEIKDILEVCKQSKIVKWKDRYINDNVLDGTQWNVTVTFQDGSQMTSYFSNYYTENFKMLSSLFTRLSEDAVHAPLSVEDGYMLLKDREDNNKLKLFKNALTVVLERPKDLELYGVVNSVCPLDQKPQKELETTEERAIGFEVYRVKGVPKIAYIRIPFSSRVEGYQRWNALLFAGIDDYTINNPITYSNEFRHFSVSYPDNWEVKEDKVPNDINTNEDGSPDNGITIYINNDKDNWIYVYGQVGHISISLYGENSEEFITDSGTPGRFKYYLEDDRIRLNLVLDQEFHGVSLNIGQKVFEEYKKEILGIMKSIVLDDE